MKITSLRIILFPGLFLICGVLPNGSFSQTSVPAAQDPAFAIVADDPTLPRVLLIGDSISIGYTVPVRSRLKGRANLHRIPENGGPTTNGLAKLQSWLGDGKWDVIHFNWGLHDLKIMPDNNQQVSTEAYEKNLRQLVQQLKATKARLIWASTTPVPEGVTNPVRHPTDVLVYNRIAKKIMDEQQIEMDDLYSFCLPQLTKIQRPANVHFTDEGSEVLAKKVAASIESVLPKTN
jgi:acyl-CoA thioesterase-1